MKVWVTAVDPAARDRLAALLAGRGHEVQGAAQLPPGITADLVVLAAPAGLAVDACLRLVSPAREERPDILAVIDDAAPARVQDVLNAGADDVACESDSAAQLEVRVAAAEKRVSRRQRFQRRERLTAQVVHAIGEMPDLRSALALALQMVCEFQEWDLGEMYLPTPDGTAMTCQAHWSHEEASLEAFIGTSASLSYHPNDGLVGRIWARREPYWSLDLAEEPDFQRRDASLECGLRAGLFIPLLTDEGVLAVAAFYVRNPRAFDEQSVKGVAAGAIEVGRLLERRLARDALRSREEQLRQAQKLEAVGRLAGGVAHDFNNVLTAILGYAEILLGNRRLDTGTRQAVEEIRAAGERAASLTHQLLLFSRKQVAQLNTLDAGAVVSDVDRMLRRIIGEDVQLVLNVAPQPHPILADRGQLEQVLLNLSVNARDAMPNGGRLSIEVSGESVDGSGEVPPGRYVRLTVRDTGCGMDEEVMSHLFEPFFTTKEQGKGTGLGLSTVYGIVQSLSGHVRVRSRPGQGAAFHVYLPAVAESCDSEELPAAPPSSPRRSRGELILLVEDDGPVRHLVHRTLLAHGYEVIVASCGKDAVRHFEERGHAVSLVITDVVMPGMSGRELAEHLALLQPGVKVLYTSGYNDDEILRHGVRHSEARLLQKPFKPHQLLRYVREAIDEGCGYNWSITGS